jgi:hypothetical protein
MAGEREQYAIITVRMDRMRDISDLGYDGQRTFEHEVNVVASNMIRLFTAEEYENRGGSDTGTQHVVGEGEPAYSYTAISEPHTEYIINGNYRIPVRDA